MQNLMTKLISSLFYIFLCLFLCVGCVVDEQNATPNPVPPGDVDLDFSLRIRSSDNPMSRAGDYDFSKTPGESKISTVSIFVVGLVDEGGSLVEDWSTAVYRMVFNPSEASGYYNITMRVKAPSGKKHIYIAANMSHAQTLSFLDNEGVYRSTGSSYRSVIDEFADPTTTGLGIIMLGQLEKDGSKEINLSGDGIYTFEADAVELKRVVSKTLMVCKTKNTIEGAVSDVDYGITTNSLAWVRLEDVYFSLQPTAKVLFIDEQEPIDDYVSIGLPLTVPPSSAEWMKTLKYEANRIGVSNAASDDHYTEGLYCLSNKTSGTAGMSTQLTVRAKYLPNKLVTGYTTERVITSYTTEAAALAALAVPSAPTDEDGLPVADYIYPAGTYWLLDDKFYTYEGMIATIRNAPAADGVTRDQFLPYLSSLGYYQVEVDASKDLLRNYYYILTVLEFGIPKHTLEVPDGGEIEVNSQKLEWIPRGKQNVHVKPE